MLAYVHTTFVLRFDCEPGWYSLSWSSVRRREFVGTPPSFERSEGVYGGLTYDLRSERGSSSGYPLQLHGVREEKHRSRRAFRCDDDYNRSDRRSGEARKACRRHQDVNRPL